MKNASIKQLQNNIMNHLKNTKRVLEINYAKEYIDIVKKLVAKGFLQSFLVKAYSTKKRSIIIFLKYCENQPAISSLSIVKNKKGESKKNFVVSLSAKNKKTKTRFR
jgi:ribosomal protein S8